MSVSPRLKYPLVAGIGTTNKRVATATRAAKIAADAILSVGFFGCVLLAWFSS